MAATGGLVGSGGATAPSVNLKSFYRDRSAQKIKKIHFDVFDPNEVLKLSEVEIVNPEFYAEPGSAKAMPYGPLDRRLGTTEKKEKCGSCDKTVADCEGHFGVIKLELPVFHIGYFKWTLFLLQCTCKQCGRILLPESERLAYLNQIRAGMEIVQRKYFVKEEIGAKCKRCKSCPYCAAVNGTVKKVSVMRLVHEKYKVHVEEKEKFYSSFEEARRYNPDLEPYISKAQEDITPIRALTLFKSMRQDDCEILATSCPERFILTTLLVPPVIIRPSVSSPGQNGTTHDDLTSQLSKIVATNNVIRNSIMKGNATQDLMNNWDYLQLLVGLYYNADITNIPAQHKVGKPQRGFCQRMKGKPGRFRGNLSGKRVDFSARTVISPDPNLSIDQVGVPVHVAKILTFPERVFAQNIEKLRGRVLNGSNNHPGANFIEKADGSRIFLVPNVRRRAAQQLEIGDVVLRHLEDDDMVLFNRQPSLHRMSIMCHRAKVMPWRTFRFNECVCGPYNADFDGDEMNMHLPQTIEARAEALMLMAVPKNLVTPKHGKPLIAATQDFITGAYLLSRRDIFLSKAEFTQVCTFIFEGGEHIDIPPPAILRPIPLWTGKQVFSIWLRPNRKSNVNINLDARTNSYAKVDGEEPLSLCPKDGFLVIRNSQHLAGVMDKKTLGSGGKDCIFHILLRDYGSEIAADRMSRLAKFTSRWLMNQGFSIGISDVWASDDLVRKKTAIIASGYKKCDDYIALYNSGKLNPQPGCTAEETLESHMNGVLSSIREKAGQLCVAELHPLNSPLVMTVCGSKGGEINISQMVACVGQQTINDTRVPEGFVNRTLPHFGVFSRSPEAKGFVKNSFFSGMTATEFFFHTMGGREGLVDTAVKTASTGYMYRRLMKALEDLQIGYDMTVRNSENRIVQFEYGGDNLDPCEMEGAEQPCDFDRIWLQMVATCPDYANRSLTSLEMASLIDHQIDLHFKDTNPAFLSTLLDFVNAKTQQRAAVERRFSWDPPSLKKIKTESGADSVYDDSFAASESTFEVAPSKDNCFDYSNDKVQQHVDFGFRITRMQLITFFAWCLRKYKKAVLEPGTTVGAIAAQSIGEPGTQMTLKTFHFAGVASMNITQGVPRILEIINGSKSISTPVITAQLITSDNETSARLVKARIEKTTLGHVCKYIKEVFHPAGCYLAIKLDKELIKKLFLNITAASVASSIANGAMKLKTKLRIKEKDIHVVNAEKLVIYPTEQSRDKMYFSLQSMRISLPDIIVQGLPSVERCIISKKDKDTDNGKVDSFTLLVEGTDFQRVMTAAGVDGTHTLMNHVIEVEKVLGVEAARSTIIKEIQLTLKLYGMAIDTRHVMLLADVMTFKGQVHGITRFGIEKMRDSVMMLASFEKTNDHLFDAAIHRKIDPCAGVSECIILGAAMGLGTGLFKVMRPIEADIPRRKSLLMEQFDSPKLL